MVPVTTTLTIIVGLLLYVFVGLMYFRHFTRDLPANLDGPEGLVWPWYFFLACIWPLVLWVQIGRAFVRFAFWVGDGLTGRWR